MNDIITLSANIISTTYLNVCVHVCIDKFSNSDENKVEYMEIFVQYSTLIENTLNSLLSKRIPVRIP